jgi:RNA polymerase sigma-70 factor (ECF subfamily)
VVLVELSDRLIEPFAVSWHKAVMNEAQLVTTLRNQDPQAVQELVDLYGDRLLRSALLLCGDENTAEDLVQDTFLEAIRSAHRFQGRSAIYTWLHGILLNLTRRGRREQQRLVYDEELVHREVSPAEAGLCQLDAVVAASALVDALRQLSDAHREVVVLRYYENMKMEEISMALNVSIGTVKSRLHYALTELQKILPAEMNLFGVQGTEEIQKR